MVSNSDNKNDVKTSTKPDIKNDLIEVENNNNKKWRRELMKKVTSTLAGTAMVFLGLGASDLLPQGKGKAFGCGCGGCGGCGGPTYCLGQEVVNCASKWDCPSLTQCISGGDCCRTCHYSSSPCAGTPGCGYQDNGECW